MKTFFNKMGSVFGRSKEAVAGFFRIKERNSTFSREIVGGITTFLAMAYILFVNPSILAATGMSQDGVFLATALAAAFATLAMALIANLPIGLAPHCF